MSAVATFLKGKVEEGLTALVQPAGLVPAALFVLLQLAFVLPQLRAAESAPVAAFDTLDDAWKAVVIAVVVLLLGYLLTTLASNVIDTLAGESWRRSWAYRVLVARTRARLESSSAAEPPAAGKLEGLSDRYERHAAYPLAGAATSDDLGYVGPTALGNAIRATYRTLAERYGIDAFALSSALRSSVDKESATATQMTEARASLETLVNVAFVLAVFAVESIVLFSALQAWSPVLLSSLALVAAYLFYRAAVPKARAWGDALEVACDLHRNDMRKKLGLREPTSADDERQLWQNISRLLLWGDLAAESDREYEVEKAPAADITTSSGVGVVRRTDEVFDARSARSHAQHLELGVVVSNEKAVTTNAFLAISDTRVPFVFSTPAVTVVPPVTGIECEVDDRADARPDVLVIRIPGLGGHSSVWLRLTVPVWRFACDGPVRINSVERREDSLDVELVGFGDEIEKTDVTFAALNSGSKARPSLTIVGRGHSGEASSSTRGEYRWDLKDLKLPTTLLIAFEEERDGT